MKKPMGTTEAQFATLCHAIPWHPRSRANAVPRFMKPVASVPKSVASTVAAVARLVRSCAPRFRRVARFGPPPNTPRSESIARRSSI